MAGSKQNPFSLFGEQQQMLPTPQSFVAPLAAPTAPVQPQVPQAQNPFAMFMQWMMSQGQQQQQPFDFQGLLRESRNDPQGDANKGYVPGVNNASNPFANGFFNARPTGQGYFGDAPIANLPPTPQTVAPKKPVRSPFASY